MPRISKEALLREGKGWGNLYRSLVDRGTLVRIVKESQSAQTGEDWVKAGDGLFKSLREMVLWKGSDRWECELGYFIRRRGGDFLVDPALFFEFEGEARPGASDRAVERSCAQDADGLLSGYIPAEVLRLRGVTKKMYVQREKEERISGRYFLIFNSEEAFIKTLQNAGVVDF